MKLRANFERVRAKTPAPAKELAKEPVKANVDATASPAARNLALAHHLQRLIDRGLIADYTAAARMLGVSQPRLTHLMGLLLLAPELQTAVLLGEMRIGDKELRVLARIADWDVQVARVSAGPGMDTRSGE
jgi:hypothetical protein